MSFRTKGQDDMEIKNICTFVKAAELGNFTKAAQELGYAQSTVTAQIQQLENEVQEYVQLIDADAQQLQEANDKVTSLQKQLSNARQSLTNAQNKVESLTQQLEEANDALGEANAAAKKLPADISVSDGIREALKSMAR